MKWGRRSDRHDPVDRRPDEDDAAYLARLVHAHLGAGDAARWLGLTRPAIRLATAAEGDTVVARLGGRPCVPDDFEWPVWEGHGPLAFVGEVGLDAVARTGLDPGLALPTEGRLLAFYFDGSYDDFVGVVGPWDTESLAGARLIPLSDDRAGCRDRPAPERVREFRPQDLTARQVTTFPDAEHPVWEQLDLVIEDDDLIDQLDGLHDGAPLHQIGGWADPVQGPVELEVADAELAGPGVAGQDVDAEALKWSPLLQIDSDDASEMMWGDSGRLYWLTRSGDSAPGILDRVSFTWQCS